MTKSQQLGEQLAAKRAEWKTLWDSKPERDFTADEVKTLETLNSEMTDISKEYDKFTDLEAKAAQYDQDERNSRKGVNRLPTPGANGSQPEVKGFRERFDTAVPQDGLRAAAKGRGMAIEFPEFADFKTLLTLSNINNQTTRLPGIVRPAQETQPTVIDLFLQGTTDNNAISYFEETTFTNNAATVAEGGTKPESALGFTERTDQVRKIATNLPVTDELLDDYAGIRSYIEERLAFMVERREDAQVLNGDGVAPNILGLLNRSGIQTQAKGTDPTPDAVYKAMQKVRTVGFAEPTAYVTHPNDWTDIRLLRTADGMYIWGNPADAGPERIWGLTVRQTTGMTENTGLVGAFRPHAQIFRRMGITITASTEHSTFFAENKVLIQAESRLALAVYRPSAFCTVTGL